MKYEIVSIGEKVLVGISKRSNKHFSLDGCNSIIANNLINKFELKGRKR